MVRFNYNGKDYELGFNRVTAAALEKRGFTIEKITDCANLYVPMLVNAAFQMKHSSVKAEKIDEIYNSIGGKVEFVKALCNEYLKTTNTLFDDAANGEEENTENLTVWNAD